MEWDGKWKVETQKTDYGYSMMFVIPLSTITYAKSDWGIRVERFISEKGELQVVCNTGSFQALDGIASIEIDFNKIGDVLSQAGRRSFELLPSFYVRGFRKNASSSSATYSIMYGGNIRIKKQNAMVFDLAIHPDFSDIEADIQEISISRKPIYYPEKRPFFMEGRDLLVTPVNLLRTRNFENVVMGLKFYTKSKKYSSILYVVRDEVFDTISFGKVNYSPAKGYNVGIQYIFQPASYKFLSSDFTFPLYKRKNMGARFQFSRRFDSTSSLVYGEIYRRSEFTGLNAHVSFTHIDKKFLTPLATLYFDDVNEIMLNVDYGISAGGGISIKPSVFFYLDRSSSTDTMIDKYFSASLLFTKGRFSFTLMHQKEDMPYLPYDIPQKDFRFSGASLVYSSSSYENLEVDYLKGKYLGSSADIKSVKLKLNPFGVLNIGVKFDDYSYDRESGLSSERLLQVFGIVSAKRLHLVLKPYAGYRFTEDEKSLFTKNIVYLSISENLGLYGVFQLNHIKTGAQNTINDSEHTIKFVYNF